MGCLLLPRLMPQRWADTLSSKGGLVRLLAGPLLALQRMSTMRIPWLLQVGCRLSSKQLHCVWPCKLSMSPLCYKKKPQKPRYIAVS